jgi:formimidoylglutamate deiminase
MAGLTEFKTSDNDSFWSWRDLMYQYANQINSEQLYHIAKYTYSEMLEAGYTSVCEFHYIHRDLTDSRNIENMSLALIKAAHEVGIALTLLPVLYTQAHINGSPLSALQQRFQLTTDEYITLYKILEKKLHPEQNMGICFHSLRAVSIKQIQTILKSLDKGQPIHIHIAEQQVEIEQIQQHTQMRPVEYIFHNFNVNKNWCLVHATHLNDKEIALIAHSQAIAGICPLTEANLGDGTFPLPEFLQQKGRLSIGSDSHILINPFQEMQMLEYSQRLHKQQRVIASTPNNRHVGTLLWTKAVTGGSQACQLAVDGMQIGQLANWISLDTSHPSLVNLSGEKCLDSIIFANNQIPYQPYLKGEKIIPMQQSIKENYKNTLKSLRN